MNVMCGLAHAHNRGIRTCTVTTTKDQIPFRERKGWSDSAIADLSIDPAFTIKPS